MNKQELKENNEFLKQVNDQYFLLISFKLLKKKNFFALMSDRGNSAQQSEELYQSCKKIEQDILSNILNNFTD